MTIKNLCVADGIIHYKGTVDKLLKTALYDDFDQDKHQRGHSRRLPDHSKGDTKRYGSIPRVPGHILDIIRKGTGKQTLCVADYTIHYKETVEKLLKNTLRNNFDQDIL